MFLRACAAEGLGIGTGYRNWCREPLFQNVKLYGQLWPVRHVTGAEFRPLPENALPNDEEMRRKLLVFPMPAVEMPNLMDEMAAAAEKVASAMPELARRRRKGRRG